MKGEFIFHPVGHGLFYSGTIHNNENESFNFIYDIGSMNSETIINAVTNYTKQLTGDIDILFLSHLDKDHINGLQTLMSQKTVKSTILPFLIFENLVYLKNKKGNAVCNDIPEIEKCLRKFLSDFYSNPYKYLNDSTNDSCKVFFYSSENLNEIRLSSDVDDVLELEEIKKSDDEHIKAFYDSKYTIKKVTNSKYDYSKIFIVTPPQEVKPISYKGWFFDVRQPGYMASHRDKLLNTIKTKIGNTNANNYVETVHEIFEKIKSDINNIDCITLEHFPSSSNSGANHTLLTGDSSSRKIYNPETNLLSSGKNYKVVQIPHHGTAIPKKKSINLNAEYSVVCKKQSDKRRPNKTTFAEYKKISTVVVSSENNAFDYSITVT